MSYQELCLKNKNTDNIIGLSLLISHLEKEKIINNYIDDVLQPFMNNILNINDENEIYKMLISFYNISQIHYEDKEIPKYYINILTNLKQKNLSSKIKFKLMDILNE